MPRESSETTLLFFHLSGLQCAFPLEDVREIVPMAKLSSPPGMPSGLEGFLDLRGTAVPILRLDRLFKMREQRPGLHTPLIILRVSDALVGVLVESIQKIIAVAEEAFLPLPANHIFHDFATAAVAVDGEIAYLLCSARILLANERHLLTAFQAAAQQHLACLEEEK